MQKLGEIARVERYGKVGAVGVDGQVFLDVARLAVRADRHVGLRYVKAHEVVVLFGTRHKHRAVDRVLEQIFGDIDLRVEVLGNYLAVIDERAVDKPRGDGGGVHLHHEEVFVKIEFYGIVVVRKQTRNFHDRADGHRYARGRGGGKHGLYAFGKAITVGRDRDDFAVVNFQKHAF